MAVRHVGWQLLELLPLGSLSVLQWVCCSQNDVNTITLTAPATEVSIWQQQLLEVADQLSAPVALPVAVILSTFSTAPTDTATRRRHHRSIWITSYGRKANGGAVAVELRSTRSCVSTMNSDIRSQSIIKYNNVYLAIIFDYCCLLSYFSLR
jgi:hypothetical protein